MSSLSRDGEYQERTTTNLDTCLKFTIPCPNSDCRFKIAFYDISTNQKTCEYEPVLCKYTAVGCNEKPTNKKLKKHEENALFHLQVATEKNLELSQKVASLEKVTSHLRKSARGHTFKLTNYQQ